MAIAIAIANGFLAAMEQITFSKADYQNKNTRDVA